MTSREQDDQAVFSIGTVSSLCGVSPNTIRTWERRYNVLTPKRSAAGGRRYSDEDVERLQLLRQLTESGAAISSVASLSRDQLSDRLGQMKARQPRGRISVTLLHPELQLRIAEGEVASGARRAGRERTGTERAGTERFGGVGWRIVHAVSRIEELSADGGTCEVLIVKLDQLGEKPEQSMARAREIVGARHVVVLYHFAPRALRARLGRAGACLLQEPITLPALAERVGLLVGARDDADKVPEGNPAPRFSTTQVARLRERETPLGCECPNHLASLLSSLGAFEKYSLDCIGKYPDDAELHRQLYRQSGEARVLIEDLLVRVLAAEEIPF